MEGSAVADEDLQYKLALLIAARVPKDDVVNVLTSTGVIDVARERRGL